MKHIGKITNTDQRCIVVMMQIPGREDHALVTSTDGLPPKMEQAVMDVLQSNEGQAVEVLYEVLHRRLMPDVNKTVLQTLHENGYLAPVPVSNIVMLPKPNMPFPLTQVLLAMGRSIPGTTVSANPADTLWNQHQHNIKAQSEDTNRAIARNLMFEADALEAEVAKKRALAYAHDASLRPTERMTAPKQRAPAKKPPAKPKAKMKQAPAKSFVQDSLTDTLTPTPTPDSLT